MTDKTPLIFLICGSVRPGSMTRLTTDLLEGSFISKGFRTDLFHPENMPVRHLGSPFEPSVCEELQQRVRQADAVVICTPEYHGCFSSVIMSVLENLGYPSALRAKPVSLLGVAAGKIGAIKALEHLRAVCSHMGALVLPASISLAEIHEKFDEDKRCISEQTRELIETIVDDMDLFLRKEWLASSHICGSLQKPISEITSQGQDALM